MTNGSGTSPWPSHVSDIYQEAATQLRFMKRQQWAITNYLLALLVGILAVDYQIGDKVAWVNSVAITMSIIATLGALKLLRIIESDMAKPRLRMAQAHGVLLKAERDRFDLPTTPTLWTRDLPFVGALGAVCVFGALIISYAVAFN